MGTGSKVFSVILRLSELCSSIIIVALLSRFFYLMRLGSDGSVSGRLIYVEVISCLEIIASIILVFPYKYSFYAWPLDTIFFVCSIVAFGLLADLNSSCDSYWYWNYWGYYWGRFWTVAPRVSITANVVDRAGCGSYRAILAFLFMGAMAWMLSAILGLFVFIEIREGRETHRASAFKEKFMRKPNQAADPETQQ
ncbi:hypothetical protein BU23DRAFT_500550 [Bimuria novae-zelandiae CBS 107.79]|uniref:MARVEL domain-containing protein n=1 Tax=Bimuria novae-zelandiae CBS 107.79 TaxID=1447943 RepID=A0A6A5VL45_9PLEO|nr:hypothetical protein BU23DRAFT_500550 [Bimuria novae-zelandiae CBS 107.79]